MKSAKASSILCVGLTPALQEIRHFAAIEMGEVNRSLSVSRCPAGKGTNVARVLKTLGAEPVLTGFIGGATGEEVVRGLKRLDGSVATSCAVAHDVASVVPSLPLRAKPVLGVRTAFVPTAAPTRVCITLVERETGRTTELVEEAALPSDEEWRAFRRTFARLLPRARVLTLTGALMPGAPATVYRDLAGLAAAKHVTVIIDSQREPLLEALTQRPALAKLNVHELENSLACRLPTPRAIVAGARQLVARGARHVLVTHGARGAWLVSQTAAWFYPAPKVAVCNPIGSGDAVTAGIAFGLSRKQSMREAVRLGLACGAANVLTPTPGTVEMSDVKRLLRQVSCRRFAPRNNVASGGFSSTVASKRCGAPSTVPRR